MKNTFTTTSSMVLLATMAYAASAPMATQVPELQKRQGLPGGLDLSSLLANPSSALAEASSLLANPTISSLFSSITADPGFQSSLSAELVSELGSSSASLALEEFSSFFGGGGAAAATTSSGGGAASTTGGSGAPAATSGSSSGHADGSPATFSIAMVGSVISLSAAVFLFAM